MQNKKSDLKGGFDPAVDSSGAIARHRCRSGRQKPIFSRPQKNFVDMTALIRSIQRAEGHTECYRKLGFDLSCDQMECEWRTHCFYHNPSD